MSEFDEIEASIRDNNLPDDILERNDQAVARYSQEKETLYDNLDAGRKCEFNSKTAYSHNPCPSTPTTAHAKPTCAL